MRLLTVLLPEKVPGMARAWARFAVLLALFLWPLACTKIPPGRSAVDGVSIDNLHTASADDIEERLATAATPKFLGVMEGVVYDYNVLDDARLQRDLARVERYLRGHGFLDARARAGRVVQVSKQHVRVTIVAEEGLPTINRTTTLKGILGLPKIVQEAVTAVANNSLKPGDRFDEEKFHKAEAAVKSALTDHGFAFAKVSSDGELDPGDHVADYVFTIDPGPLATFGPITIVGLDPDGAGPRVPEIPESAVRRTLHIREGTPYSTAEIEAAKTALLDLNVFSSAEITPALPDPPPVNPVVPLTVKLEPTRLRELQFGGGAEFDVIKSELHLLTAWENHNFFGGLRDFRVEWKPGVVLYPLRVDNLVAPTVPILEERFSVTLRQPSFIEARTTGTVRLELNVFPLLVVPNPPPSFPVVGYLEPRAVLGVERTFFKRLFISLNYNVQVEDPFHYPGTQPPDTKADIIVLAYPELITQLDLRDDALHPHSGILLRNSLQVAAQPVGSFSNDVRVQPEIRTYVPLGKRLTFATRGSVGFLFAFNYAKNWASTLANGSAVPNGTPAADLAAVKTQIEDDIETMYFRAFFSGGPNTNRGFALRGVAPYGIAPFLSPSTAGALTALGLSCIPGAPGANLCFIPVGGFSMWELSNDLRLQVSGPFAVGAFCDMGDVSPVMGNLRFDHLHLSCGGGLRYDTPVGPIRLDVGYRVQPLQVLGCPNESTAAISKACSGHNGSPVNGTPQTIFGQPIAISIGIGEAF